MAKRDEPKCRVHIMIYEEDWEKLGLYFGTNIARSGAIRELVRASLRTIEARVNASAQALEIKNDDIANLLTGVPALGDKSSVPG